MRNRWYDPQLGRFISEDPIGLAGGINRYVYASNRPLTLRDPWGLYAGCVYGRLPTTDPHYGGAIWTFVHDGAYWTGVSVGAVFVLCPGEPPRSPGHTSGGGARGDGSGRSVTWDKPRFCRRAPERPEGVDVDANVAIAEWARINVPTVMRLYLFKDLVNYDAPWDYKTGGMEYEAFGNWHYGITGTAMGFSPQVLLRAAGWAQQKQPYADLSLGNWWDIGGTYGDEVEDHFQIRLGISAYNNECPM